MKREMTAGAALLLALAGTAAAQETASAPVTATVEAATLITVTGTTNFGTVPGYAHSEVIDPLAPSANQSTARFTLLIGPGARYDLRLADPCETTLTRTGGSETMRFYSAFAFTGGNDPQASGQAFPECTDAISVSGSTSEQFHFWLGGRLQVNANQTPGSYTGTYRISVEVVNL